MQQNVSEAYVDDMPIEASDSPWAITGLLSDAHKQAREIIENAKAEAQRIVEHARKEAEVTSLTRKAGGAECIAPVHSAEISTRQFPKSFRGLNPESVYQWLYLVESSHATLEDELDRLRAAWDEVLVTAGRMRSNPEKQSVSLARTLSASRPNAQLQPLDTSATRELLEGRVRNVKQARASLAASRVQLARMQHRAAVLRQSNEQLRSQLLEVLTEGCS